MSASPATVSRLAVDRDRPTLPDNLEPDPAAPAREVAAIEAHIVVSGGKKADVLCDLPGQADAEAAPCAAKIRVEGKRICTCQAGDGKIGVCAEAAPDIGMRP